MSIESCQLPAVRWLIIGLGNPDKKYQNTRHNVGHWVIERLESQKNLLDKARLVKTSVYMNSSGEQVKELVDKYKVPLNNLVVVHDDLDIELREFKLQKGRGAAGHRGVESVINELGSGDFWRLRVGIGRPKEGEEAEEYVLNDFSREEREILTELIGSLVECLSGNF